MKKAKRPITWAAIIVLILLAGSLCFPRHFETVAAGDELKFGMTPFAVRMRCGAPDETEQSAVAPEITYTYFEEIDGKPSACSYTFIRDRLFYRLYDVSAQIEVSESEAADVYKAVVERCRAEYQPSAEKTDDTSTELAVSNGAVSLHCKIEMKQSTVAVRITRIW